MKAADAAHNLGMTAATAAAAAVEAAAAAASAAFGLVESIVIATGGGWLLRLVAACCGMLLRSGSRSVCTILNYAIPKISNCRCTQCYVHVYVQYLSYICASKKFRALPSVTAGCVCIGGALVV